MLSNRKALIIGASGQDGPLLAESLSRDGWLVIGTYRNRREGFPHLSGMLHYDSTAQPQRIHTILDEVDPDVIVYLAGQSSVASSWISPADTTAANAGGYAALLEALEERSRRIAGTPKLVHASSSEMFGSQSGAHRETTPLRPNSPYALSKAYAHSLGSMFRESHGLPVSNAIMFNHESQRRPLPYVFRRISLGTSALALGLIPRLSIGSLSVTRDWGSAVEYARALSLMCASEVCDDYIIATGQSLPLKDVVNAALEEVGLGGRWDLIHQDPKLFRPGTEYPVAADPSKIGDQLGWSAKRNALAVIREMVRLDLRLLTECDDPVGLIAPLVSHP